MITKSFAQSETFVIEGPQGRVDLTSEECRFTLERVQAFLEVLAERDRRAAHGHPLKSHEPSCKKCEAGDTADRIVVTDDDEIGRLRAWLEKIADTGGALAKRYAIQALDGAEIH